MNFPLSNLWMIVGIVAGAAFAMALVFLFIPSELRDPVLRGYRATRRREALDGSTALRLLWRLVDRSPPLEETEYGAWAFAAWTGLGAKMAHLALYILLIAVPVVGIAVQFARGDALSIFGLFDIASPWPADRAFARSLKEIHEVLAHGLMAVAGLHAAAALVHHWVFGDRTLVRMLPGSRQ